MAKRHSQAPIITLTTDFGTRDGYVGAVKGVVLSICPAARIVDITHDIAPQDLTQAALALEAFCATYPTGTIHMVVVDPGVGGERRALSLRTPECCLVGPDNGVLDLAWRAAKERFAHHELQAVALTETRFFLPRVSPTFHGRDLFAPVAAHLACGADLSAMGPAAGDLVSLTLAEPVLHDGRALTGEVIHVDRFGNCVTNIKRADLERLGPGERLRITAAGQAFGRLTRTYAAVERGAALCLLGSSERLELAMREASLAAHSGIGVGIPVRVDLE